MSSTVETANEIRPFRVDIADEALEDLRRRIAGVRWPTRELVADRSQGCSWPPCRPWPAIGPPTTTCAGSSPG
jgi:hypothetical protein